MRSKPTMRVCFHIEAAYRHHSPWPQPRSRALEGGFLPKSRKLGEPGFRRSSSSRVYRSLQRYQYAYRRETEKDGLLETRDIIGLHVRHLLRKRMDRGPTPCDPAIYIRLLLGVHGILVVLPRVALLARVGWSSWASRGSDVHLAWTLGRRRMCGRGEVQMVNLFGCIGRDIRSRSSKKGSDRPLCFDSVQSAAPCVRAAPLRDRA